MSEYVENYVVLLIYYQEKLNDLIEPQLCVGKTTNLTGYNYL